MLRRVFACPDTGDDFIATLKTACLYSKQIDVFTALDAKWVDELNQLIAMQVPVEGDNNILALQQYRDFVESNHSDLLPLVNDGIVNPLFDISMNGFRNGNGVQFLNQAIASLQEFKGSVEPEKFQTDAKRVEAYVQQCQPALHEILLAIFRVIIRLEPQFTELAANDPRSVRPEFWLQLYFSLIKFVSNQYGSSIITRDASFLQAMSCRTAGASTSQLGRRLIEERLPTVEHLQFETIVKFRSKFVHELEMFWAAIEKMESELDRDAGDLEKQVKHLMTTQIRPSVAKLRNAVEVERRRANREITKAMPTLMDGVIVFAACSILQMPNEASVGVAAVAGFRKFILDAVGSRLGLPQKIDDTVKSNEFAILLRVEDQLAK